MTLDDGILDKWTSLHIPSCACQQEGVEVKRPHKRRTPGQEYLSSSLQQIIAAGVAEGLAQWYGCNGASPVGMHKR